MSSRNRPLEIQVETTALANRVGRLEVEFGTELDDSGGISAADSTRNCAEGLGVEGIDDGVGVGVEVLEEIEEVDAELEVGGLGELDAFGSGEVVIDEAGHTEGVGAR